MKERVRWIDILRAMAMLAVVLGHTVRGGDVQCYLYSFHIGLFMFISGLLASEKQESFGRFLWKDVKRLLVPYFVFGIISVVIYQLLGAVAARALGEPFEGNLIQNFLYLLYGSSKDGQMEYNHPLWSLTCLFVCDIIWYLIKTVKDKWVRGKWFIPACVAVFALLGYLNSTFWQLKLPFQVETALVMMVFYLAGKLLKKPLAEIRISRPVRLIIALALIVSAGALGLYNGRVRYSADVYNNYLLFLISAFGSIIGYLLLAQTIEKNRVLEYVGASTMAILVMHKFPILFFQTILPLTKKRLADNDLLTALAVAAVAVVMCLIADKIITMICPPLLGKRKKA
ncbi:MAG: acyltransferase [Erysipelotrichaceae bacterium]|nr:acyltransferase [Erysipelotrichaceae bacterium]